MSQTENDFSASQVVWEVGATFIYKRFELIANYWGAYGDTRIRANDMIQSEFGVADSLGLGASYLAWSGSFDVRGYGIYGFDGWLGSGEFAGFIDSRVEAGIEACRPILADSRNHSACVRLAYTYQTGISAPLFGADENYKGHGIIVNFGYRFSLEGLFDD